MIGIAIASDRRAKNSTIGGLGARGWSRRGTAASPSPSRRPAPARGGCARSQTAVLKCVVVTITGTRPATCSRIVRVSSSRSSSASTNCSEKLARMQRPLRAGVDHEVDAALLAREVERAVLGEGGRRDREDAAVAGVVGSLAHGGSISANGAALPRRGSRPGSRSRSPRRPAARARRRACGSRRRRPCRACCARSSARRACSSASGMSRCRRPAVAIELDPVAVAHRRQRAAGARLGRHVQHHGAVGGAAHARIGDAHHVGHALRQQLGRQAHVADLGHAGVAAAGRSSSAPAPSRRRRRASGSTMRAL